MTEPSIDAHMSDPAVVAAEQAWNAHFNYCTVCQAARGQGSACDKGQELHEKAVLAAHAAWKEAQ